MKRVAVCACLLTLLALLGASPAEARRRSSGSGITSVRPTVTRSGTYRQGHYRTTPDGSKLNNWSTKGNVNPITGKKGTKNWY